MEETRQYYGGHPDGGRVDVYGVEWFKTDGFWGWFYWDDNDRDERGFRKLVTERHPDFPVEKSPVQVKQESAISLLNEAQAKIVSVGMNSDFGDLKYGDSPWIPDTQEDASRLISKAVKLLEES